jgi:hypothetical protein
MTWGTEPGQYQLFIGPNSRDLHSTSFLTLIDANWKPAEAGSRD